MTPHAQASNIFDRVKAVVEKIRPAVISDGGDLELVEVTKDGVAKIRLHGACVDCPSRNMTLQSNVQESIRRNVPEVMTVEQVQ